MRYVKTPWGSATFGDQDVGWKTILKHKEKIIQKGKQWEAFLNTVPRFQSWQGIYRPVRS
jgi:hypothetical protein